MPPGPYRPDGPPTGGGDGGGGSSGLWALSSYLWTDPRSRMELQVEIDFGGSDVDPRSDALKRLNPEGCTIALGITGECDDVSNIAIAAGMSRRGGAAVAAAWMAMVRLVGASGERVVAQATGLAKNATYALNNTLSGMRRIPDFVDEPGRRIIEAKNVSSLSYTSQLRDMAEWAYRNYFKFELWVREGAEISPQLREAINAGVIQLVEFKWP